MKFFLEPFYMKDYLFMNKELAKMTLKQCFHVQKWKNGIFLDQIFFFLAIFSHEAVHWFYMMVVA